MRPAILDELSTNEQNCAHELAKKICSKDYDLCIRFIQHPILYNHIPERIGCILDMYDFSNDINWNEKSSILYIDIKDEYKQSHYIPLHKIKKFAKKIGKFFLLNNISNFYMNIEIYKGKCSESTDCKIVYRDYITANNTIDVKALIGFVYTLPILFNR